MANTVSGNPYLLDTVTDAIIVSADFTFHVYAIHWTSGSAADSLVLQDAGGVEKYRDITAAVNASSKFTLPNDRPIVFNGLKMPTIDAGTVRLYVKVVG